MPKAIDLTGQRFGRLIAVKPVPCFRPLHRGWKCICDCGKTVTVRAQSLRNGKAKSCGCLKRDGDSRVTHGYTRRGKVSPTYQCWQNMHARCRNPKHPAYSRYGGRGITVCDRWSTFANFLADMGERPEGLEIERLDSSANYEPRNCKWATLYEKGSNKRTNRRYTVNGITKTVSQWAEHIGIGRVSLWERIKKWPLEKALTTSKRSEERLDKTRYGSNWYRARRAAMKRSGGICQRCKKAEAVHVHHRMPMRYFERPEDANFAENLMAVCHPCHKKEHREMAVKFPLLDTIGFENSARRSRRDTRRFITWRGQTKTLTEWGKLIPDKRYPVQWLSNRLRRYSIDKAMEPLNGIIDAGS